MELQNRKNLQFRVSTALKSIIGKDLINDKYIAVFELVKNAYDAGAKRVDIIFENVNTLNSKLIIKDDGKGMDLPDIRTLNRIEKQMLLLVYRMLRLDQK